MKTKLTTLLLATAFGTAYTQSAADSVVARGNRSLKKPIFLLVVLATMHLATAQTTPYKTDSLVLDNAVLYYHTYGTGAPIVILSGRPGIGAFQESDVAENLGKTYRAILFEQRGTGRSWTKPVDGSTINVRTAVEDLERLRTRLGVDKLNLYGHSWGAVLASAYTAQHPDRVGTLILSGSGEINLQRYFIYTANMTQRRLLFADSLRYWSDSVIVRRDRQRAFLERRRLNRSAYVYDPKKLPQYEVQINKGLINEEVSNLMWTDMFRSRLNLDTTLPAFKGPTLIVFGWQDPIGTATFYPLKQSLPQAEVQGINFCSHLASIEQPEKFFGIVNDFLSRHLASPKSR
ncbi:alpha/beta fold hydrolase [Fibrella aquatilis]|uniref:Alpha/beta hydrolase n=1 Tax=Fibrella aquatilis TaxID=2817059 RepID=A0A939GAE4_9BACT|nr:alpha/beta hydrolase [Fibrella aquatilis]MBO0933017.1 alpha/beta hydrolase [Fibrella aquatilis]